MAKNKAKMNKFVTGVATAAMVATAVVPVASAASFTDLDGVDASVKVEIDKAVDLGFFKEASKFNPSTHITRGQAALTLARYIAGDSSVKEYAEANNLEDKVTLFKDVPASYKNGADFEQELFYASLVVKNAEAFNQDNLNPAGNVTRSQMAKIITQTFGIDRASGYTPDLTDIGHLDEGTRAFIETIASHEITKVTKFMPAGHVTRSQMASFLVRANDVVNQEASIVSVKATNSTDLSVTVRGTTEDLKASDFGVTVNGSNAVVSATKVSATQYTLQLSVPLSDEDVVVVKGAGDLVGSATVTYTTPEIAKIEGVAGTVFTDKAGQELAVKVNGAVTSVSDLAKQGYTISFQANQDVFGGTNKKESSTGILDETDLNALFTAASPIKTFKYKVSLQKDNKVVTSENVSVTISQDDKTAASTIKSVALSLEDGSGNTLIEELTSGKLVSGETAQIDELIADLQDGRKNVNLVELTGSNVSYESSDVTIANVNATGEITAGSRTGKVTITVTSGNQTKDINLEVVSAARELTTATYNGSAIKLTNNAVKTLSFSAKDQYGDIFNTASVANIVPVEPVANGKVLTVAPTNITSVATTATRGLFNATVTASATEVGSGTLQLKVGSKTIAATSVAVAKEVGQVKQTLVKSANQIDLNPGTASKTITFNLENLYNGYFKENADFDNSDGDYVVKIYDATKPTTPIYEVSENGENEFKIHATDLIIENTTGVTTLTGLGTAATPTMDDVLTKSEVGTALVVVEDANGNEIDKINFNIVDTSANATSATFNTAVEFTNGNATGTLNLGDLITNVVTTAAPYDGVLRYHVNNNNAYVYYSAEANVVAYNYDNGDVLVGVIEATPVTSGDTITLGASGAKFLANEITVSHSLADEGNKAQFNFYKRGDVSVGKATYTKKD